MNTNLNHSPHSQTDYIDRVQSGAIEPGWALFRPSKVRIFFNLLTDFLIVAVFVGFLVLFLMFGDDQGGNNTVFVVFFGVFALLFMIPFVSTLSYALRAGRCFVLITNTELVHSTPRKTFSSPFASIQKVTRIFRRRHGVWPQTVIEVESAQPKRHTEISSRYYAGISNIHSALQQLSA